MNTPFTFKGRHRGGLSPGGRAVWEDPCRRCNGEGFILVAKRKRKPGKQTCPRCLGEGKTMPAPR